MLREEGSVGYVFGLRGSREAAVQAEALEAKALMCLRRLTRSRGSDPPVVEVLQAVASGRDEQPTDLLRGSEEKFGRTWTIEKFRN